MSTLMSSGPMVRKTVASPVTPGRKVAGWVIICFTLVPLAMAAREGMLYLWIGGTALVVGGALALWPGRKGSGT